MRDPLERTKVVVRHLPPAIAESTLLEQIDGRFSDKYKWFCFRPGKSSSKSPRFSRAYIDFKRPEDVLEFAEFFHGHTFVNEKGAQFKAMVEYSPSQRAPRSWSKKDGREGTIFKDLEYIEFLELVSKPSENLPSAEVQLERKEAERAGQPKDTLIITPLMDYVRQKRAAKSASHRTSNGKPSKRAVGSAPGSSASASIKRGSEKRRTTPVYILRDTKTTSSKDKSSQTLVAKREDQVVDKIATVSGAEDDGGLTGSGDGCASGVSGTLEIGKRKVLLLKGKEKEISGVPSGLPQHASPNQRGSPLTSPKQTRRDAGGRIIKSILSSKDSRQNQSSVKAGLVEQQLSFSERRPPRPPNVHVQKDHISSSLLVADGILNMDEKDPSNDVQSVSTSDNRQDRRPKNKDKLDRGVWAPLRRLEGSHSTDEIVSSSGVIHVTSEGLDVPIPRQMGPFSKVGNDGTADVENGSNMVGRMSGVHHNTRLGYNSSIANEELRIDASGSSRGARSTSSSLENGSHKQVNRRAVACGLKEVDGCFVASAESKPAKKGGAGYSFHEKQVWVQKSASGS